MKDNPEGYWFKNKLYGYGWTPAKPAGWLVVTAYILLLLAIVFYAETNGLVEQSPTKFLSVVVGLTTLLIVVCWKTGEPLKWQWGKRSVNE